jgi:hypothetical protein
MALTTGGFADEKYAHLDTPSHSLELKEAIASQASISTSQHDG